MGVSILKTTGTKYKYSLEKDILVLPMAVFKFIPIMKKLIDVVEGKTPEQIRNVSSYILIVFLSGWAALVSSDVANIWFNGQAASMDDLHFPYIVGISLMIFIMYFMKTVLPMTMRIAAVKSLGKDAVILLQPSEFQELCECDIEEDCVLDTENVLGNDGELSEIDGNSNDITEILEDPVEKVENPGEEISSSPEQ